MNKLPVLLTVRFGVNGLGVSGFIFGETTAKVGVDLRGRNLDVMRAIGVEGPELLHPRQELTLDAHWNTHSKTLQILRHCITALKINHPHQRIMSRIQQR